MHERKNFHTANLENQTTKLTSNLKQHQPTLLAVSLHDIME